VNESGLTCILNFLSIQKRDDARQFMKFLHPDLGVGNSIRFFFISSELVRINWLCISVVFEIWKHFWLVKDKAVFFSLKICNFYVWSWQNFQKDLMALTVVYICLKTLQAGLRMFMYDFFHNLCFCLFSPKIVLFFALSYLEITWGLYIMFHFSGDTFWWICSSSCYWMVGEGNIDS